MDENTMMRFVDELQGQIDRLKKMVKAAEKSDVTITPALSEGVKVADFEIDGNEGSIYSPTQVNSDWNATEGAEQILNKPTLGTSAVKDVQTGTVMINDANIVTGAQSISYIGNRLITTAIAYSATNGVFFLGEGVPTPDSGRGICLVARNAQTAALYVLTWSSTANGFSIVHTLAGNAPTDGQGAWVQYIAGTPNATHETNRTKTKKSTK